MGWKAGGVNAVCSRRAPLSGAAIGCVDSLLHSLLGFVPAVPLVLRVARETIRKAGRTRGG